MFASSIFVLGLNATITNFLGSERRWDPRKSTCTQLRAMAQSCALLITANPQSQAHRQDRIRAEIFSPRTSFAMFYLPCNCCDPATQVRSVRTRLMGTQANSAARGVGSFLKHRAKSFKSVFLNLFLAAEPHRGSADNISNT